MGKFGSPKGGFLTGYEDFGVYIRILKIIWEIMGKMGDLGEIGDIICRWGKEFWGENEGFGGVQGGFEELYGGFLVK